MPSAGSAPKTRAASATRRESINPSEARLEALDGCQVVARIGRQIVLSCELLWQVNLLIEERGGNIPPSDLAEARYHLMRRVLSSTLDLKLLYNDFRSKVPEANLAAIHGNLVKPFEEERIPALMKQLGVENRGDIDERLNQLGGSLEDVRQEYYQSLIAQSWAREGLKVDRTVTHQQLLDYYKKHGETYDYPSQAKWEELMVSFARFDNRQQAWAAISAMGNQAFAVAAKQPDAATPAFAEIAKAKSQGFNAKDGGAHDWTTKGSLAAEKIDEALFTLPEGQMSPILQTDLGFHIVRVLERKEAGRKSFEEVQQEIRNKIRGARFNKAINEKVADLRKKTQIWTVYTGSTTAQAFRETLINGAVRR